jgi:hypothetical protein
VAARARRPCIVVDNGTGTTPVAKATIESLQIEGNNIGSVGTPVSGIYFRTYHGRLNNVFVRRTSGYGIHIEGYTAPRSSRRSTRWSTAASPRARG